MGNFGMPQSAALRCGQMMSMSSAFARRFVFAEAIVQGRYLDRREAAEYLTDQRGLRISRNTLQKMATLGGGPPYRLFGIRAVYTVTDLEAWAEAKLGRKRSSTSELKGLSDNISLKNDTLGEFSRKNGAQGRNRTTDTRIFSPSVSEQNQQVAEDGAVKPPCVRQQHTADLSNRRGRHPAIEKDSTENTLADDVSRGARS